MSRTNVDYMTFDEVQSAIAEIKEYRDLQKLKSTEAENLCKKYNITGMQLNYLLAVVAAERIKEAEIM